MKLNITLILAVSFSAYLLLAVYGCAGNPDAAMDGGISEDENQNSDAPTLAEIAIDKETEQLLDILRTADHADCQRAGEGWPLGECPDGCLAGRNPRHVLDRDRMCRIHPELLGGPSFCVPEEHHEEFHCTDFDGCFLHSSQRVALIETVCERLPSSGEWSSGSECGDYGYFPPDCVYDGEVGSTADD